MYISRKHDIARTQQNKDGQPSYIRLRAPTTRHSERDPWHTIGLDIHGGSLEQAAGRCHELRRREHDLEVRDRALCVVAARRGGDEGMFSVRNARSTGKTKGDSRLECDGIAVRTLRSLALLKRLESDWYTFRLCAEMRRSDKRSRTRRWSSL